MQRYDLLLFLVISLFSFSFSSLANTVEIQESTINEKKYQDFLEANIHEVMQVLPNYLKGAKFDIKVKKLSHKSLDANFCGDNQNIYAYRKGLLHNTIYIHSDLVALAYNNPTPFSCKHGTYEKSLKATLFHELMHLYDKKYHLSRDQRFLDLIGGSYKKFGLLTHMMNSEGQRSADTYEYKNAQESLAVNFEYFMLDPNFQCKKPAFHHYLKKVTGLSPSPAQDCKEYHYVLTHSNIGADNLTRTVALDPTRVYQIHYLLADKAKAIMSRWGHGMFRLVVCAPFRKTIGPDCLKDVSYHLVISYRANVSDFTISYLAGLFGQYPSQVFIYTMAEIVQEYTKLEFRDLWSVPLKMSREEVEDFVQLSLEKFWAYKGKYYFITNNCGTESLRQYRAVVQDEDVFHVKAYTPKKMFQDLLKKKLDLVDFTLFDLNNRAAMVKIGLMFPSMRAEYQESIKFLATKISFFNAKTLASLKLTRAVERRSQYETFLKSLDYTGLKKLEKTLFLMKLYQVENYISTKYQNDIPDLIFEEMKQVEGIQEQMSGLMEKYPLMFVTQWKIVEHEKDFGVPAQPTIERGLELLKEARENNDLGKLIREVLKENTKLNEVITEIQALESNEAYLRDLSRNLLLGHE